jgi:hypothetical protein
LKQFKYTLPEGKIGGRLANGIAARGGLHAIPPENMQMLRDYLTLRGAAFDPFRFHYLYLFQQGEGERFKVGVSGNVERRLRGVQGHNPNKVRLAAGFGFAGHSAYGAEAAMHTILKKAGMRVSDEWFAGDASEHIHLAAEVCAAFPGYAPLKELVARSMALWPIYMSLMTDPEDITAARRDKSSVVWLVRQLGVDWRH